MIFATFASVEGKGKIGVGEGAGDLAWRGALIQLDRLLQLFGPRSRHRDAQQRDRS